MEDKREFLRHTVATLAYRATRALENAPEQFAGYSSAGRTPVQILAHMGDLFDWALSMAQGAQRWHNSQPLPWFEEVGRFYAALQAFDAALQLSDAALVCPEPIHADPEALFQGPIADALTHVGQLSMLRRLAGSPTRGENFYVAAIAIGQTGADQPAPIRTF